MHILFFLLVPNYGVCQIKSPSGFLSILSHCIGPDLFVITNAEVNSMVTLATTFTPGVEHGGSVDKNWRLVCQVWFLSVMVAEFSEKVQSKLNKIPAVVADLIETV